MEEILAIVVFGVGAKIGMKAVEAVGTGFRPLVHGVMRGGIAASGTTRRAVERARETASSTAGNVKRNLDEVQEEARSEMRASRSPRRSSQPRRIDIVRE